MNTARLAMMALLSSAALAAGCTTTSAPVDPKKTQALSVEQISQQWKQGNDLVTKGEDVKRKAQSKMEAASLELKEGDSLVARGKTLMNESEQAFRDSSRKTSSQ